MPEAETPEEDYTAEEYEEMAKHAERQSRLFRSAAAKAREAGVPEEKIQEAAVESKSETEAVETVEAATEKTGEAVTQDQPKPAAVDAGSAGGSGNTGSSPATETAPAQPQKDKAPQTTHWFYRPIIPVPRRKKKADA